MSSSSIYSRGRPNATWWVSAVTETRPKLYTTHSAEPKSRPKVHSHFRPKPKPNVYCPTCMSVACADRFVGRPCSAPIHAARTHLPWYDVTAAYASLICSAYQQLQELCIQATAADFRQPAKSTTHFRQKPKVSRKFQFDFWATLATKAETEFRSTSTLL